MFIPQEIPLTSNSTLKRDGTNLTFKVTLLSHWSDILCAETGETDRVKWYGGDKYISATKGYSYSLVLVA